LPFDLERDQYAIIGLGWEGAHHYYSAVANLEIINGKIRIRDGNTQEGIAADLGAAGVRKDHIIWGLRHPDLRPFTEYAAA
jgi:hypothetical protein